MIGSGQNKVKLCRLGSLNFLNFCNLTWIHKKIMLEDWNFKLRYQATKKLWVGYKQLIVAPCSHTWICNIFKIFKGVQLWNFSFQFRKLNPLRSGPFLKPDWELTFHAIQSSKKSLRLSQSHHSSYLLINGSAFLHVLIKLYCSGLLELLERIWVLRNDKIWKLRSTCRAVW